MMTYPDPPQAETQGVPTQAKPSQPTTPPAYTESSYARNSNSAVAGADDQDAADTFTVSTDDWMKG